jgi:large subunit ribosomal protein L10
MVTAARLEKEKVLSKITGEIDAASMVLFVDFRGLSVGQITDLRRQVRKEGGRVSVYKNTLTRRALSDLGVSYPDSFLIGPSAVVHTEGDVVKLTKTIVNFSKGIEKFSIKGGLLEKSVVDPSGVKALAELPGREELLSKLVGVLQQPITQLVQNLSSPTRGLVYVLSAIKEKKQ